METFPQRRGCASGVRFASRTFCERKHILRFFNDIIFDAVVVTGSITTGSSAVPLERIEGFSVQAIMAGTGSVGVTGSFKLQASLDRATNVNAKNISLSNWTDVSGSSASIAVAPNASHSVVWNVSQAYYPFVRVHYTNTAGSGSLTARVAGKGA